MPFQAKFAANYPLPSWNARPKVLPKPCLDVSDKLCFGLELSDKFGTNAVSVLNYKVLVLKTNFPHARLPTVEDIQGFCARHRQQEKHVGNDSDRRCGDVDQGACCFQWDRHGTSSGRLAEPLQGLHILVERDDAAAGWWGPLGSWQQPRQPCEAADSHQS